MPDELKKINIYTDGACSGNPGAGGWGAILSYNGTVKELSGGEANTTNNRMELTAVIEALSALKQRCDVVIHSDSKYIIDAVEKKWVYRWKQNGWKRNAKEPALNPDLWDKLLTLLEQHNVSFEWVKGHNGHPQNERCDHMAVEQLQKYK